MSPTRQEAIHQWGMEIRVNTIQTVTRKPKQKQLLVSLMTENDIKYYNLVKSIHNTLTPSILLPFLVLYLWCVLNTVTTVFKELI